MGTSGPDTTFQDMERTIGDLVDLSDLDKPTKAKHKKALALHAKLERNTYGKSKRAQQKRAADIKQVIELDRELGIDYREIPVSQASTMEDLTERLEIEAAQEIQERSSALIARFRKALDAAA